MSLEVSKLSWATLGRRAITEGHEGTRVSCSHGSDESHCATKLMWTRVQMGVIRSLQRTTLGELVEFAQSDKDLSLT